MNGKIIRVTIDQREYLFKLNSEEEAAHLQDLAEQLEQRIQHNKRGIATTDYTKVLIVTCLDLLEEIIQTRQNQEPQTEDSKNDIQNSEISNKLKFIRSLLKEHNDHS